MWFPVKVAECSSLSSPSSWLIVNLYNLIQLKMTFIKLHYLLDHKLLVLQPQGDMHTERLERFCSAVAGCNSKGLVTAGNRNVSSQV